MDLSLLLDLPNLFSTQNLVVITSDDLNNSSFLIHSLIQQKARLLRTQTSSGPLVLILLNQSYSHYSSVAAKSFGLNLKALKDTGRLKVIDVVKDIAKYMKKEDEGSFDIEKVSTEVDSLLQDGNAIQPTGTATIMIDDISVLSSLGLQTTKIYSFLLWLRNLSLTRCPAVLIVQSTLDGRSEEEDHLEEEDTKWIQALHAMIASSQVYVNLQKLETGFSDKIDGSLFLHDYQRQSTFCKDLSIKYHFKSAERSTKIFAPGSFAT